MRDDAGRKRRGERRGGGTRGPCSRRVEARAMRAGGGVRDRQPAISGATTCACSTGCRSTPRSKGSPGRRPAALYALSMRMHIARHGTARGSSSRRWRCAIAPMPARIRWRTSRCASKYRMCSHRPIVAIPLPASRLLVAERRRGGRRGRRLRRAHRGSSVPACASRAAARRRTVRGWATGRARIASMPRPVPPATPVQWPGSAVPPTKVDCAEIYDAFSGAQIQAARGAGASRRKAPAGAACEDRRVRSRRAEFRSTSPADCSDRAAPPARPASCRR